MGCKPRSLDEVWPELIESLDESDRAFAHLLCFGSLRWWSGLHYLVSSRLKKPIKKKDRVLEVIMVLGLYQIVLTRTPAHAAIHTSVELAKSVKGKWAAALVNAVLRSLDRAFRAGQIDSFEPSLLSKEDSHESLSIRAAHPEWMVRQLANDWPEDYLSMLTVAQVQGPICIRVNESKINRQSYLDQYQNDLSLKAAELSEAGIYLPNGTQVKQLPGFQQGLVSVQDEGAQLAVGLLVKNASNMALQGRVLDACAAPGGKAVHWLEKRFAYLNSQKEGIQAKFADTMKESVSEDKGSSVQMGDMYILDKSSTRMARVEENLDRFFVGMGRPASVHTLVADAAKPDEWWDGNQFAAILLDVPCSGSGVIRRHPDIKWLRREADIDQFANQQLSILESVWPLLQYDGIILYCTCSYFSVENEKVIAQFLEKTQEAVELPLNPTWGHARTHGVQKLPEIDGSDGFYFCMLKKKH